MSTIPSWVVYCAAISAALAVRAGPWQRDECGPARPRVPQRQALTPRPR